MSKINQQISQATKWSSITQIIAKFIAPITTMVLARLLTPEAFGVVATVTMIISFTEIFTDAGFQKYIIQHEFENDIDKYESTTVAFWTNLAISLLLWVMIALFSEPLARLVGSPGLGYVITISCVSLPLSAFSSIQMALFKRDFDFKSLFHVRILGILIPLVVTIPLAFILRNFWALIIGTIVVNLSNAIILTIKSTWKPNWFYQLDKLKEMFSFSSWTMIESISIWLTGYSGIFIVGVALNEYYLGIYKTSIATVGQILGLIISATTPILFSALSRLQDDDNAFNKMLFQFQKVVGILILPIGVGIFIYSEFFTKILLGDQWAEAAGFIGIWSLVSVLTILLSHYSSEVYRAKGKPKLSVLVQLAHLVILIPALLISVKYSFEVLYYVRSLVRLQLVFTNLIIMYFIIRISIWEMIKNIFPAMISAILMGIIAVGLQTISSKNQWTLISIIICCIFYFFFILLFPLEKQIILNFKNKITHKIRK